MTRYLVSIYQAEGASPAPTVVDQAEPYQLNEDLQAAGPNFVGQDLIVG